VLTPGGTRRSAGLLEQLQDAGISEAGLYGEDPGGGIGGAGGLLPLLDEPEVYGLPPDAVVTTRDLLSMWRHAAAAAAMLAAAGVAAFAAAHSGNRR
jgi:formate dehydrogenase iron-sulfur subunit